MNCIYPSPAQDLVPWEVLDRRQVLNAAPWLEVFKEKVRLPDGRVVDDYYQAYEADVTVIVAQTPEGRLLIQRLYRHGLRGLTWSLPGGATEAGEEPLAAAQRELLEETGFSAPKWIQLGTSIQDGSRRGYWAHAFLALDARQSASITSTDLEDNQLWLMDWREATELIVQGAFREMGAWSTLLLARLHLEQVALGLPKK